jgi:hypothetical protein
MVVVGDRRVGFDFLFGSTPRPFGFSKFELVSQIFASWNPLMNWLRQVERLRHAA